MTILLAVDPGVRACGCAVYVDGRLFVCALVRNPEKSGHGPRECALMAAAVVAWWEAAAHGVALPFWPDELAVELPQVYPRGDGRTKGDANVAVVPLAMVDAAIAALLYEGHSGIAVASYFPRAWKGVLPKETADGENIVERRLRARFDAAEVAALEAGMKAAKSLAHNVVDACGVGAHHIGRFGRKRAFARE